jgi:formate dehydrogenase iron-sulfur subunit
MTLLGHENALFGPVDPALDAGHADHPARMGFFTDTSVCIGCKACEVACKTWNAVPEDGLNLLGFSYDNTGSLGADTWRHVAFIEQPRRLGDQRTGLLEAPSGESATPAAQLTAAQAAGHPTDLGMPAARPPGATGSADGRTEFRWLMSSDVCKHCTHAGCLDVCPTGALFRTEFGTVVVQSDICNGCGYCVAACPYGVIERREGDGRAWKCTLCYDRIGDGLMPACAQACPTQSIQYGPLEELRERAANRLGQLHAAGVAEARLYGENPDDGVGGQGAFFLLLDEPEVYGMPPDPAVPTRNLAAMWRQAGLAAATFVAGVVVSFLGGRA